MTPDVEELIKRVNTLTVDKNRLRQKLSQISNSIPGKDQLSPKESQNFILQHSPTPLNRLNDSKILPKLNSSESSGDINSINSSSKNCSNVNNSNNIKLATNSTTNSSNTNSQSQNKIAQSSNVIGGVECLTSCEDDLLFMNELYRKRLDEYNDNWIYIQSKCTALLSELNALQENYSMLKKEKLDLEEKLRSSCDESDKIKSELQTVVLNYETQLSAMSEHLSMITSQVSLEDGLARAQPH